MARIDQSEPSLAGCNDLFGPGGQSERLRFSPVMLFNESQDRGFAFLEWFEDCMFQAAAGRLCEEALHGIESRCGGRCEVEGQVRVFGEPLVHFRGLACRVVVQDDVDLLILE